MPLAVKGVLKQLRETPLLTLSFLNRAVSLLERCGGDDGLGRGNDGRCVESDEGDDEGVDGPGEHGGFDLKDLR